MTVANAAAIVLLEEDLSRHDLHLLMIFVGLIAVALVVQALGFVTAGVFAAKLLHRVDGIAHEVHQRTGPMIDKTSQLVHDLGPKVQSLTENAEQISFAVRAKIDEVGETVSQINRTALEANARTRAHMARADGIVTDALNATEEMSHTIQDGIRAPVRQIAGVLAGFKAMIDTLISRSPFGKD
jgi:methyl-accepting chemotaxis protein